MSVELGLLQGDVMLETVLGSAKFFRRRAGAPRHAAARRPSRVPGKRSAPGSRSPAARPTLRVRGPGRRDPRQPDAQRRDDPPRRCAADAAAVGGPMRLGFLILSDHSEALNGKVYALGGADPFAKTL